MKEFSIDNDFVLLGTEFMPIDTYYYEIFLSTPVDDVPRNELLSAINDFAKQTKRNSLKINVIPLLRSFLWKQI